MKVCLDPGHGGKDAGAVGPTKLKESTVNLNVALELGKLLKANGFTVSYTRTTDVYPSLTERWQQANRENVNYFISVHANSDGPTAVGIETLHHTSSSIGRALAAPVQQEMIARTGDRDRGLKARSDLAVLNGTKMPAILVEVGFISHPATEAKFKEENYINALAEAIGRGLARHAGMSWKGSNPAPPPIQPTPPPNPPMQPEEEEPPALVFPCPHCAKEISVSVGPNKELDVERVI